MDVYMKMQELFEAISVTKNRLNINNILTKLVHEFSKFMDDNMDNEMLILSHIIDKLNSSFHDMDIVFKIGDVNSDEYVATGETDTTTSEIDITIDESAIFGGENSLYSDSQLWMTLLSATISHELLHREQIKRSRNKIDGSNISSDSKYLSNKHEIQAHAKDAIDIISKFSNVKSKTDILKYLKFNLEDAKSEIEPIGNYWDMFGETNKPTWNRFLKYLMFYANDY